MSHRPPQNQSSPHYNPRTEMRFCRRCGSALIQQEVRHVFVCEQGHPIFCNASPAVALILRNGRGEIALVRRAYNPGKGMWDAPGGFCDGMESAEDAARRETLEEIGVRPDQYTPPQFLFSMPNEYLYNDEMLPTLDVIFTATLTEVVELQAADDAQSVHWVRVEDIDLDDVAFVTIRRALELLLPTTRSPKA